MSGTIWWVYSYLRYKKEKLRLKTPKCKCNAQVRMKLLSKLKKKIIFCCTHDIDTLTSLHYDHISKRASPL